MREKSSLSSHIRHKDVLYSPFNKAMGSTLKLNSWPHDRLPEYIWLGLLLENYGRKDGFNKAGNIFFKINKLLPEIDIPAFSNIMSQSPNKRKLIFKIIAEEVDPSVLSPLTIVYTSKFYPNFTKYFYNVNYSYYNRLSEILNIIEKYFSYSSNEATDLQYLILLFVSKKNKFEVSGKNVYDALRNYSQLEHTDSRMSGYRSLIRSMAFVHIDGNNLSFCKKFWRSIGMVTNCEPLVYKYKDSDNNAMNKIRVYKEILKSTFYLNKENVLSDPKFNVMMGLSVYALKILLEINDNSYGILSRMGLRTLIEINMIIKYILLRENEKPDIWDEYRAYGINQYKLVLLKIREESANNIDILDIQLIDLLVNEDKWEELIDVDLNFFDKDNIRNKFNSADKPQYNNYDYLSSYSHGLWGAIRESSMLHCNNPAHIFHSIPDIEFNQKLPNAINDSMKYFEEIYISLKNCFKLSEEIIEKLNVCE
ncbi:MAG: DUF5677 domain-containing protein [Atribacterota bacterium]|nr:DUF5677 domain-containing protein [Atribacterota bacterium]